MGKLWEKLGSRGSLCYESFRRHGAAAWIRISLKRCAVVARQHRMVVLTCLFLSLSISEISGAKFPKKVFWLCERAFRSRLPCAKRVGWGSWERGLTDLARVRL